jgi:STE24 endopeptidase
MRWLVLVFLVLLLPVSLHASETPAEHAANQYAQHEIDQAPPNGNLPDYTLAPADLAKAQHLAAIQRKTHFADEFWGILQIFLLLQLGVIASMRDRALRAGRNRWLQGYTFLFLFIVATFVLNLPLAIYSHHLSLNYGLSVQHWPSWFLDQLKSLALTWGIGGLLVMLLFWLIRKLARRWWLVFWACTIPISLFGLFAGP